MHLQVKKQQQQQQLKVDLFTTLDKSFFGSSSTPRQRQITFSPKLRRWTKKTYLKMYCFKSNLTPATLYFLSTFLIYILFLLGF